MYQAEGKGGVTVRAKVIRADGTEEDLGVIAHCPGNPKAQIKLSLLRRFLKRGVK